MLLGPWTTPAPEINSNLIKAKTKPPNVTNSINQSMLLNSSKVTDHNLSLQTATTFPKLNSKSLWTHPRPLYSTQASTKSNPSQAPALNQSHWTYPGSLNISHQLESPPELNQALRQILNLFSLPFQPKPPNSIKALHLNQSSWTQPMNLGRRTHLKPWKGKT